MNIEKKQSNLKRRQYSIRKRIEGTAAQPRISIYRSNKHIYAQAIDDIAKVTLAAASDEKVKKGNGIERAQGVGAELGEKLKKLKVEKAVFDRKGRKYHGRVKALADSMREAGIHL